MTCARCQNEVDGSDYPHWQKVCWPCKATLDARVHAAKLEKENRELRTKQQLSPSSNWAIEDARSVAEIENEELRTELAAARLEIEALRVKPWQEQIEGQSAVISRLRYEKGVAEAEAAALRAQVERLREGKG